MTVASKQFKIMIDGVLEKNKETPLLMAENSGYMMKLPVMDRHSQSLKHAWRY